MAGASLLTLLDDIASVLDDVALMTKVAAKKTAGVLGDDLALNAQQVTGIRAERELPVVWAVAKGSLKNKLILVPAALVISIFVPVLVTPLLMVGGAYLCFEGFEKIVHKAAPKPAGEGQTDPTLETLHASAQGSGDLAAMEKEKIKGAVRTDFILSAEIIVISLGTVSTASWPIQLAVLALIGVVMTAGVYGAVAGIVKLDDAGLYLSRSRRAWQRKIGAGILRAAPYLMKTLSIVGTAAMFLVGGGILVHGVPLLGSVGEKLVHGTENIAGIGNISAALLPLLWNALVGIIAGGLILCIVSAARYLLAKLKKN